MIPKRCCDHNATKFFGTKLTCLATKVMVAFLFDEKPKSAVYIGDNLKYLQRRSTAHDIYFDVIYIDPPYNTGNHFSYNDKRSKTEYLNFMRKRLVLAREILAQSGVIFISIDDSQLYSLKLLCDEIFGSQNFLGNFITFQSQRSNSRFINTIHEYILCFAKDKKCTPKFTIKRLESPEFREGIMKLSSKVKKEFQQNGQKIAEKLLSKEIYEIAKNPDWNFIKNYNLVDESGEIFFAKDLSVPGEPNVLNIPEIGLKLPKLKTRRWSSPQKFIKLFYENKLSYKNNRPYEKHLLKDSDDNVSSILNFYSRMGTNDLNKLGLRDLFDTPKPVELIKYLIRIATNEKSKAKILDFFAGSGTTGQAVYEINNEDKKNHIFHLVQLDEKLSPKSKAYRFAQDNNLSPTADQLLLKRLEAFCKKYAINDDFEIRRVNK